MTDWLTEYSAALDQRDGREQAHKPYIDACATRKWPYEESTADTQADTKLADRTAGLTAQPAATSAPLSPQPSGGRDGNSTPSKGRSPSTQDVPTSTDALQRLRSDLASTQKARSALQTEVNELTTSLKDLQLQQETSTSQVALLTRQKADVERKLRDREEEIRLKSKLVEQAQDEQVALGLQLNMAEERSSKLEKENKELVDRWMKRMGEEVERVNRDSKWE